MINVFNTFYYNFYIRKKAKKQYEDDSMNDEEIEDQDISAPSCLLETRDSIPDGVHVDVSAKCKCGSTSHKRTSHKDCPLRKRRPQVNIGDL